MHHPTRLHHRIVVALVAALTMTMTAWAGVPNAPVNLAAVSNGTDGFSGATLTWEEGDGNADGYKVYMSNDGGSTWQMIGQAGDTIGTTIHEFITEPLANGTYQFQVGAWNSDGESARSNTATVVMQGIGVRFIAPPFYPDPAFVGVPFERDFDAEASDEGELIYRIHNAPPGITIDSVTGIVSGIPEVAGTFRTEVTAVLADHPAVGAGIHYVIVVAYEADDLCAKITGSVSDAHGMPIQEGTVNVIVLSDGHTYTIDGHIGDGGQFEVPVPAGVMIVQVTGAFKSEYYRDVTSMELAERLPISCGDDRTLDIVVEPATAHSNGRIGGTFTDTAGHRLVGRVIAYRIDSAGALVQADEMWASHGFYLFEQLPAGEYVIWGNAGDSIHVPGYHRAAGVAALSWIDATRVNLAANDSMFNANLEFVYIEGEGGQARLRGTIVSEGGRIRKHEDPHILGATPVAGATVYAMNASSAVFGYAITDVEGRFEIAKLEEGSYTLLVDRVGLRPLYEPVGVSNDVVTEIDLTMTSATSSVANAASGTTALAVHPNPVDASAMVRFNATAGTTQLRLIDLRGEAVVSMAIETVTGENSVRLQTASLPAGVYLLQIGSGSGSVSTMITVAR